MMRSLAALTAHSLRRTRALLVAVALLLCAFQFLLTQVAAYMYNRMAFNELASLFPDALRTFAGPSGMAFLSFSGVVALGYFHPVVVASLVGLTIAVATEPAAEIERRFVDLTLARPITRNIATARTGIVLAVVFGAVLSMMFVGTQIGLRCCTPAAAPRPSAATIASLAIALASVLACWAGLAFAAASLSKRRAVAASSMALAALVAYLLDYLGRAWTPAYRASVLSPFHYFEPMSIVIGAPLSAFDVAVLLAIGACGAGVGAVIFARRDL